VPSAITLIRSASLSSVAEYAYAATASAGARLIVLAGACPLNADGSTAAPGDYAGQAAKAAENMRTALADRTREAASRIGGSRSAQSSDIHYLRDPAFRSHPATRDWSRSCAVE